MTATATAAGPMVRMCTDPACLGALNCPSAARDRAKIADRTVGISDVDMRGIGDDAMVALLAQEIAIGAPKDSRGVARIVPDGCEFTVHKDATPMISGTQYAALYSGPETSIDAIIGTASEYPEGDDFQEFCTGRLNAMRAAGVFTALYAALAVLS